MRGKLNCISASVAVVSGDGRASVWKCTVHISAHNSALLPYYYDERKPSHDRTAVYHISGQLIDIFIYKYKERRETERKKWRPIRWPIITSQHQQTRRLIGNNNLKSCAHHFRKRHRIKKCNNNNNNSSRLSSIKNYCWWRRAAAEIEKKILSGWHLQHLLLLAGDRHYKRCLLCWELGEKKQRQFTMS